MKRLPPEVHAPLAERWRKVALQGCKTPAGAMVAGVHGA